MFRWQQQEVALPFHWRPVKWAPLCTTLQPMCRIVFTVMSELPWPPTCNCHGYPWTIAGLPLYSKRAAVRLRRSECDCSDRSGLSLTTAHLWPPLPGLVDSFTTPVTVMFLSVCQWQTHTQTHGSKRERRGDAVGAWFRVKVLESSKGAR